MLLICGAILAVLGTATNAIPIDFHFDCNGLPENFKFWWACGSYGVCRSGQYVQVDCVNGTSYDRVIGDCRDNVAGVNFPCNRLPNCAEYDGAGHRYPEMASDQVEDLPACTFYYTCSYGRYLGHQRCNAGTIYDEMRQACLTPEKVPPPCGTYTGDEIGSPQAGRGFDIDQDGRAVVSLPVDSQGNVDRRQWPFTSNNNNQQGGNPSRRGRPRFQQQPAAPFR